MKEELEKVVMDTFPPPPPPHPPSPPQKNLEKSEKALVNPGTWRKLSYKTKTVDHRLQEIQKLVLKSGIVVAKIMNLLYEAKQIKKLACWK